jgi:hypothetical protein
MRRIKVALKASFILTIAVLLAGPAMSLLVDAQFTAGRQSTNVPAAQGVMPGSALQQPGGLLPPRGPYACPYGYYLDPATQQCVPVSPGLPGGPQPLPYGQPYDPRVV